MEVVNWIKVGLFAQGDHPQVKTYMGTLIHLKKYGSHDWFKNEADLLIAD